MVATSRPRCETATSTEASAAELRREAVWFTRYLIDAEPSDALIERYVRGNAKVVLEAATAADEAVLAFLHEHPWSVGLLDAGTWFRRGAPLLRRKLVVMMAIVEATPDHIEATAPVEDAGIPRLVWKLGMAGAKAAIKLALGTALTAIVMRR